jgi:hypothetical protein
MRVIPYIEINGARTFSDGYIANLFRLMEKEGTAKKVFHAGSVKAPEHFIKWMKNDKINAVVVIEDDSNIPLAVAWITGMEDRRAWFNFNIFKAAWGKRSKEVATAARDHWLYMQDSRGEYLFNLLLGLTPENNRLALRMAKMCGAKPLPVIPNFETNFWTGERHGAVFSYIER